MSGSTDRKGRTSSRGLCVIKVPQNIGIHTGAIHSGPEPFRISLGQYQAHQASLHAGCCASPDHPAKLPPFARPPPSGHSSLRGLRASISLASFPASTATAASQRRKPVYDTNLFASCELQGVMSCVFIIVCPALLSSLDLKHLAASATTHNRRSTSSGQGGVSKYSAAVPRTQPRDPQPSQCPRQYYRLRLAL